MKLSKCKAMLAWLTAGTLFDISCTDTVRRAFLEGFSDFVSGTVTSTLNQTLPLDIFLSDVIRDLLNTSI